MRWISFFLVLTCFYTRAQSDPFVLKADDFYGVDDFEALYYSMNNTLYKQVGKQRLQFFDVQLGDLTTVDLINPLKILLFYKDTQTVVLLDNRMNENQRIVLSDLEPYRYIEHVRLAGERRLWLHDLDQNRLQLFNYVNNTVIVSTPSMKVTVDRLHTDYNFCHVKSAGAVHSYNSYGSRTGVLAIDESDHVAYDFEELVVVHQGVLTGYVFGKDFRFRESGTNQQLPTSQEVKSLYLKAGKLYIWDGKKITIYPINTDKD